MRLTSALTAALTLIVAIPLPSQAQVADSARAGVPAQPAVPTRADSLRPPISPRRAFLSSLLVPGSGQAALDRGVSGTVFVTTEILSLFMIGKSLDDLRRAKAAPDSIIIGYQTDASGEIIIDPETGEPIPIRQPGNLAARVSARRQHLEDWIALLIFNHFFAGADAFVAAHLWEVPARVSLDRVPRGAGISVRLAW